MIEPCIFCGIVAGELPASIVHEDEHTVAFVDLRQAVPGHVVVVPRKHVPDLRDLDDETGAALMSALIRLSRAVDAAFPNEGVSLWHSIGPAAFQEVPHLHFHVHPRRTDDDLLRVYPGTPVESTPEERAEIAARVHAHL